MLLHSAGKEITEDNLKKIVSAVGIKPDEAMIKSVVASVKQVNLDEVLKSALAVPVTAAPTVTQVVEEAPAEKKEEKEKKEKKEEKEEEKKEEEAFEGLASLFG